MKNTILALVLFLSFSTYAQEGYLSLKHYEVPLPRQEYVFNDLAVDSYNRILLAHRKGILQFDGQIWDKVSTDSTPYKFLKLGDSTYLLTRNGIGLLKGDIYNRNKVEMRYKNPDRQTGKDLVLYKGAYYYLIEGSIKKLALETFIEDTTYTSSLGFEDVFVFNKRLFAFEGNFLLERINNTWVDLNMYASEDSEFVFSCQTDAKVFFAYDNGDFFSFDGKQLQKYSTELNEYLTENYPVSGKVITNKLLIATISGGAVVVDIADEKIDYTIQYYNGLPADEVRAITLDRQGGIWLAHESGLSRAIPELPLKEYQNYPGLRGLPEVVHQHNDTLIVGTNEGLFYLAEVRNYLNLEKVLKQTVRVRRASSNKNQDFETANESIFAELFSSTSEAELKEEQFIKAKMSKWKTIYRKQGFKFKSLREKLEKKEQALKDSISKASGVRTTDKPVETTKMPAYTYKTVNKIVNVSKLKSIKYQFEQYSGISRKVIKVLSTPQGLYALCADGLYQINGTKVKKLFSKLFIDDALVYEGRLWLYGTQGLFSYDLSAPSSRLIKHLNYSVTDVSVGGNNLAVANTNRIAIYDVSLMPKLKLLSQKNLYNDYAENILVYHDRGSVKVITADGLFTYDLSADSLINNKKFTDYNPVYLKDNLNQVWLANNNKQWQILNNDAVGKELIWLKILPNMNRVFFQSNEVIYFVARGKIVKLNAKEKYSYKEVKSFIRGAYQSGTELLDEDKIELTHDNNTLKISLSTPEYLYPEGVQYQYYIKGLMDEWSEWSGKSEIEFPFIPTGKYALKIKSQTGIDSKMNVVDFRFEVLPPYWQTWWFYLLEIAFFSILILISQRLNHHSKNTYLTNAITFLTLILFIEFLATVLENNLEGYVGESPVYGFVLNVILALSISPLEKGMNKLLITMNTKEVQRLASKLRRGNKNLKDGAG